MPRSSRHKSHKQHKHSSKESREYSDSEDIGNLKERKDRVEVVTRVSGSSEKRKLSASQGLDGKEVFNPGNSEEYSVPKRRKEKGDVSGSARWSSGEGRSIGGKESKGESSRNDSEKGLKSKVSVDSKSSKSSRRHDSSSEKKEVNAGLVVVNEEVKRSSSKAESRSKSERDSSRKEYKESKDKDSKDKEKERVAERSTKSQDIRRERSVDKGTGKSAVDTESTRKQSSHSEERLKPEVVNTEWPVQEDTRNPESEKELDRRMRRKRDGSDEKDKHSEDVRDSNGRRPSTKDERHKEEKHKDEKHKDERYKDKYRDDLDRDRARDHRNRDDRVKDDRSSKDHTSERSDSRHSRDELKGSGEYRHKKSKTQNSDPDGSGSHHVDDRSTRYKDYRGKKRSPGGEDDRGDIKPRNTKEHRYEVEKKVNSSGVVVETLSDRGRSQSRLPDGDSTTSGGRRKASHSPGAHYPKDNFRHSSKQSDVKYKESMSEERTSRTNVNSPREILSVSAVVERTSEFQSIEKPKLSESPLKKERSPMPEAQVSPMQLKEKSHSSTSMDRRPPSSRTPVRRSSDAIDDREWPLEKQVSSADEFPQADVDSTSVSSSLNRTNSSSLLPPPPPTRTSHENNPSVFYEEDGRGKPINRYRRSSVEPSRRSSVEPWKGIQNWPSPVTNGYLPYQPPGGFHPMMQPFHGHGPPMFRPPPGGYHMPDTDTYSGHGRQFGWRNRPDESHIHAWDGGNSGPFGDDHMYGKQDSWDPSRHMINERNWEGQNNSVISREDNHFRAPVDEGWAGKQPGQRVPARNEHSRSVSRAESIEIRRSDDASLEQQVHPTELSSPKPAVVEKNVESSKVLNSGFCHYYLSKLDISVDLTHPDLYSQCMSLKDVKGKSVAADVTNELSAEENGKTGLMMVSNDFVSAPIFPKFKDSLFKKAMSLYKKQGEQMRARFPFLKNVPTSNNDDVMMDVVSEEPVLHLEEEGKDETIPTTMEANMEEAIPTTMEANMEEADIILAIDNEQVEDSVQDSALEILPKPFLPIDSTDLVSDPVELLVPPAIVPEVKMEEPDGDVEDHAADVAAAVAEAVAAATETTKVESVDLATDKDDSYSLALIEGYPEEVKRGFSDETSPGSNTRCGDLVDGSSEAIDECKSVNLSRIHSPESTH